MLKLYKKQDNVIYYWYTWNRDKKTSIIFFGKAGEEGELQHLEAGLFIGVKNKVQKLIDEKVKEGYDEAEDIYNIIIEYDIEALINANSQDYKESLHQVINEILFSTGLGHCAIAVNGPGLINACCYVVHFELAKKILQENLKGTSFECFNRIYNEDTEYCSVSM